MSKFKKHALISLALIIGIAGSPFVFAATTNASTGNVKFSDLKPTDSGYNEVQALVKEKVIKGFADGTFKPHQNITREHVAVILANALKLSPKANVSKTLAVYKDVNSSHQYAKEIAAVTEANIFKGNNQSFRPSQTITREQMATVLVKAFGLSGNNTKVELTDLSKIDISHRDNVKVLAQNNITIGKINKAGKRYFDGSGKLTRVQFAIFLDKALNSFEAVEIN